jgi:integrase
MAKKRTGRKRGGRNRGYFFRKGRGWYATEGRQVIPLCFEDGTHIKDSDASEQDLKEALARHVLDQQQPVEENPDAHVSILEVCQAYLENAKATGAAKTHHDRADTLFDFCFGIPPEFRNKKNETKQLSAARKEEAEAKRIHKGYGRKKVSDLLPLDIDQWLNVHSTWKGGRRSRIQAVKRTLNYGVESGLIQKNPIKGYRTPRSVARVTYLTPEQEEACYEHCNRFFAKALRVCIRTGARFGSEFAIVTSKHITDIDDNRMEWKFQPEEVKNRRLRIIRITDPDIIALVREQIERQRKGTPIFRNTKGQPWTRPSLSLAFCTLKKRLKKKRIDLDKDACMYSTRHTYAKRILQGYWSGMPTNIETLARLMGNTPQVCREHYLQWSEIDNGPLWDAA